MSFQKSNLLSINISDTELDDENNGTIYIMKSSENKHGIKVLSEENGSAEVRLDNGETNQIISAFYSAIKVLRHGAENIPTNNRLNILILLVKAPEWDKGNDAAIIVNTFNREKVGLCVSLSKGADPELWMDIKDAESIISALEESVGKSNN